VFTEVFIEKAKFVECNSYKYNYIKNSSFRIINGYLIEYNW